MIVIPTGGKIIALFGAGSDAVKIGSAFFLRIACFYPVYGLATAFRSYLEGKGDLLYSSMAGVAALVIRIISSYAMTSFYGNMVIAYAEMFSWGMSAYYVSVASWADIFKKKMKWRNCIWFVNQIDIL